MGLMLTRSLGPMAHTALALVALGTTLVGCGRPATDADCKLIVERIAETELAKQNVTDPAVVAKRKEEVMARLDPDLMKSCVGKRITDKALACVRRAKTPEEIQTVCLK